MAKLFSELPKERQELVLQQFFTLPADAQNQYIERAKASKDADFLNGIADKAEMAYTTRAKAKNLASSPEAMQRLLDAEGYDSKLVDGELHFRRKGFEAGKFTPLDPGFSFDELLSHPLDSVKEIGRDVNDVLADIALGAFTTAGTIGGAVTGAGLTGGSTGMAAALPGAMLGGMAGGALAGGTGEMGRQALGEYFGIPGNMDAGQAGLSAVLGGLSPLFFGTGAGAAAGPSLAQRWLLRRGAERAGSLVSGVPLQAIETATTRTPELKSLMADGLGPKLRQVESETGASLLSAPYPRPEKIGDLADINRLIGREGGGFDANKLSDIFKPENRQALEELAGLDAKYATGLDDAAQLMQAEKFLGSTAKVLPYVEDGFAGALRNPVATVMRAASPVGAFVGPNAMSKYIRAGHSTGEVLGKGRLGRILGNSAWLNFGDQ